MQDNETDSGEDNREVETSPATNLKNFRASAMLRLSD